MRRDRFDRDLEEEMQSHLALLAQEKRENGMNSGEARRAARRQFGNATVLLTVIGRLKPGIALPRAQADLTALNEGMRSSKDGWELVLCPRLLPP